MSDNDVPRIEALTVKNYRALHALTLRDLAPLTVFVGPNGSGKSTIFDVFAFLSECFTVGLRTAWDRRGRFRELRSRGAEGPIEIELKYRECPDGRPLTYHLTLDENGQGPYVVEEWLQTVTSGGAPFTSLMFQQGTGYAVSGENPDANGARQRETLTYPDVLAVKVLAQFARYPRLQTLHQYITHWHLANLSPTALRHGPPDLPQAQLSPTGDNLPNVIQYLRLHEPERLARILHILSRHVPLLENVTLHPTPDERVDLHIKDTHFVTPIPAAYASEGILMLLAYLVLFNTPSPPPLIAFEEPESHLNARLLPELAETCGAATLDSQIFSTTHSPFFVNGLRPHEVWILQRDSRGYTQAHRTADLPGIQAFMDQGALLGYLWSEGYFESPIPVSHAQA